MNSNTHNVQNAFSIVIKVNNANFWIWFFLFFFSYIHQARHHHQPLVMLDVWKSHTNIVVGKLEDCCSTLGAWQHVAQILLVAGLPLHPFFALSCAGGNVMVWPWPQWSSLTPVFGPHVAVSCQIEVPSGASGSKLWWSCRKIRIINSCWSIG